MREGWAFDFDCYSALGRDRHRAWRAPTLHADYDELWCTLSQGDLALLYPGSLNDKGLDAFYLIYSATLAKRHWPRHTSYSAVRSHLFGGSRSSWLSRDFTPIGLACRNWRRRPLEAVRKFYIDRLVYLPAYLNLLLELIEPERVLFGSDGPFPMGAATVNNDLGALFADLQRRILQDNPQSVFGARLQV